MIRHQRGLGEIRLHLVADDVPAAILEEIYRLSRDIAQGVLRQGGLGWSAVHFYQPATEEHP